MLCIERWLTSYGANVKDILSNIFLNKKEIKRRTKVIGAFPNEGSIMRLLVPLAIDTNVKWLERNYVSFDNLV